MVLLMKYLNRSTNVLLSPNFVINLGKTELLHVIKMSKIYHNNQYINLSLFVIDTGFSRILFLFDTK